jgi:adenylate cyclase
MSDAIEVRVYDNGQLVYTAEVSGPTELGRQRSGAEPLYAAMALPDRSRLIIAPLEEPSVGRKHLLLEPHAPGCVRLTNLSSRVPIGLEDGPRLEPQQSRDCSLPALLAVGTRIVRLQPGVASGRELRQLPDGTMPPGAVDPNATRLAPFPAVPGLDPRALIDWLHRTMSVLQGAASSTAFFDVAARAVLDLIALDSARVFLWKGNDWECAVVRTAPGGAAAEWQASRHILDLVRRDKTTFWELSKRAPADAKSIADLCDVVAAPILNPKAEVVGVLYGDRRNRPAVADPGPLTEMDARLAELIASGVASGLARLEQERAALAARVQFEQFFTPQLARQLEAQPDLLQGQDREISVLFCDIRGFSRFSEKLGPARTVAWVGDVMGVLSDCVLAHQGVLVDYIGDELMAMWGAPEDQPDHAERACRAALDMLAALPVLNERWLPVLGEPMSVGVGVNSGEAHVGNTGSHRRFKYGPLGNTVNLGSRVQGATKYLKCKLLVTGATRAKLGADFRVRRVARVRVVNIAEAVDLFELGAPEHPDWAGFQNQFESALETFEKGDVRQAAWRAGELLARYPGDGPALVLVARSANYLLNDLRDFQAVWELPGK